jgi:hypothetical protein
VRVVVASDAIEVDGLGRLHPRECTTETDARGPAL